MARKTAAAQLTREIAQALAKKPQRFTKKKRSHHVSRHSSDDAWDVAMDAILEGDPKRAAKILHSLRMEHGNIGPPASFHAVLYEAPTEVRWKFAEYSDELEAKHPTPKETFFSDFTLRTLKRDGTIETKHFHSSTPVPKTAARDRLVASGAIDKQLAGRRTTGGWTLDTARQEHASAIPLP